MSFKDVLKKSFMDGFTSTPSTKATIIALLAAVVLGIYIYCVYKYLTRRSFYSREFNVSLVALAIITAGVILTIQSSVVVSLGMVGALSIVRFRTAIKNPLDLVFLFWSISIGIICGAGLFKLALLVSLIITFILMLLELSPSNSECQLLIVNAEKNSLEKEIMEALEGNAKHTKVKSRNLTEHGLDMIVELRTKDGAKLIDAVSKIEGIRSVSLMLQNGEINY